MTDRITKAIKTQIHVKGDIQLSTLLMRTQEPKLVSCKINSRRYAKLQICNKLDVGARMTTIVAMVPTKASLPSL